MPLRRFTTVAVALLIIIVGGFVAPPASAAEGMCDPWTENFWASDCEFDMDGFCYGEAPGEVKELCTICASECEPDDGGGYNFSCYATHEASCGNG